MDRTSPLSRRGFVGLAASAAALAPLAGHAPRDLGPAAGSGPGRRPLAGAEDRRGLVHVQQAAAGGHHPGHPPRRGPLRLDQGRPPAAQEHRRAAQGGRREVPRRGHHAAELRRDRHEGRRERAAQRVRIRPRRGHPHDRLRADAARPCRSLDRLVKEFDIKLAIHNHGPEDKVWPSPLDVWEAVQKLGRADRSLHRRGAHGAMRRRPRPRRSGPARRASTTCISRTWRAAEAKAQPVEVGRGVLDIRGILRALRDVDFGGHVGLEHEKDMNDPLPGVAESIGYIRGTLAAMRER